MKKNIFILFTICMFMSIYSQIVKADDVVPNDSIVINPSSGDITYSNLRDAYPLKLIKNDVEVGTSIDYYLLINDLKAKNIPFYSRHFMINGNNYFYLFTSTNLKTVITKKDDIISFEGSSQTLSFSDYDKTYSSLLNISSGISNAVLDLDSYIRSCYVSLDFCDDVSYWNPNGDNLGENTLQKISDMDLKDLPKNTLRIIKPSKTIGLDKKNNVIFADDNYFDFEVDGKIGLLGDYKAHSNNIKGLNEYEIQKMTATFPGALMCDVSKFEFFGSERDWIENGFITFKASGTVKLDKGSKALPGATLTIGFNSCNQADGLFWSNRVYTWINDSVTFDLSYHKDVDGDGLDDDSGEVIPPDSPVDTDGDGNVDNVDASDTDNFFKNIVNSIKNVPSYADDIGTSLSSLFNMFPSPIPQLAIGAIIFMIFFAVIAFIRGT